MLFFEFLKILFYILLIEIDDTEGTILHVFNSSSHLKEQIVIQQLFKLLKLFFKQIDNT